MKVQERRREMPQQGVLGRLVPTADLRPLDRAPLVKMYVSERGGGIRRLIGSAHRHIVASYRDPQMDYGQPVEGVCEGPAVMRCATDPDIVYYQTQPFRIVLPVGNQVQSYTADLIYVTRDGKISVREIKRKPGDVGDLEYAAKLDAVRRTLASIAWDFSVWFRKDILGSAARQINIATIYYDRSASIDEFLPAFERVCVDGDVNTFGDLVRALDPVNTCRARAATHRLIMKGRVWADLDMLLEDWSPVKLRTAHSVDIELPFA